MEKLFAALAPFEILGGSLVAPNASVAALADVLILERNGAGSALAISQVTAHNASSCVCLAPGAREVYKIFIQKGLSRCGEQERLGHPVHKRRSLLVDDAVEVIVDDELRGKRG